VQKAIYQGRVFAKDMDEAYRYITERLAGQVVVGIRIFTAPVQCRDDVWYEWMAEIKEVE
jgi:hypothetical protein